MKFKNVAMYISIQNFVFQPPPPFNVCGRQSVTCPLSFCPWTGKTNLIFFVRILPELKGLSQTEGINSSLL